MLEQLKKFEIQNPRVILGGIHSITAEVTINKATDDD
jgi:hypothetical protein